MKRMISRWGILVIIPAVIAFILCACPEDDDDLEFVEFYNPDSECDHSYWVYDVNGKETRVEKEADKLYIDDDECLVENSSVNVLDLFLDNVYIASVRCGFATETACRFFWVHRDNGRVLEITGNCNDGYSFTHSNTVYTPCHD